MSTISGPTTSRSAAREDAGHGAGWVLFAGTMLMVAGVMNVIYGIAAIDNAHVYTAKASYVFGDLNTWGWFLTVVGATQFFAAFSIWNRTSWGRWVGVLTAVCNSIIMLLYLPAFPFLALTIFTIDILVIYGLIAYGGRQRV